MRGREREVLVALMLLGVFALLLAFHHVVRGAVLDGELRRQADTVHADASWRCRALRQPAQPAACLLALGPAR